MAKPDHTWIGNSCHIHSSLWRGEEPAFAGDETLFGQWLAGQIACFRELAVFLAPNDQLVQALRGRARGRRRRSPGGTTTARAGSASSARPGAAGRDADPRRRRQPVSRVRGGDRGRAARDRERAGAAAGARGERLRVGCRAVPALAARRDRRARERARWPARRSATTSSTTTSTTRAPSRSSSTGCHLLRARAALRARRSALRSRPVSASRRTPTTAHVGRAGTVDRRR